MTGYIDALGRNLSLRDKMTQELGEHEDAILERAYQELQKRQRERSMPNSFGLYGPGSEDYFRNQGHEQDAAFLGSFLQTGERPRVRVGYAADEDAPMPSEKSELHNLLMQQRLKQQGFV